MKAMSSMLVVLLLVLSHPERTHGAACGMEGYDYEGAYHSESYRLPGAKKIEGCEERKPLNEKLLGEEFLANRKLILELIQAILANRNCAVLHALLEEHLRKLEDHRRQHDVEVSEKIRKLERLRERIDFQREFGFFGYVRNTCDGQYNRITSFLDLDLINLLPTVRGPTNVTKDGELMEDCADVRASGHAELSGFRISMKKATGTEFLFGFDPYSIPDQVILTSGGKVIHDSGCTGADGRTLEPIRIALSEVTGEKIVDVQVKWNCSSPDGSGGSAWEFYLRCQQDPVPACPDEVGALVELLKKEVLILKRYLNINSHERQCFHFFDEDVLPFLVEEGMIREDEQILQNGACRTMDLECELKRIERRKKERSWKEDVFALSEPERAPSSAENESHCPDAPDEETPLFERLSWSYCKIGRPRLGLP